MDAWLMHGANVLFLASTAVRDVLWLRLLALAGTLLLGVYFVQIEAWAPLGWQLLFVSMHTFHVVKLVRERRPIVLTEDEQKLYQRALRCLTPREAKVLVAHGRFREAPQGEVICVEGAEVADLQVIVDGRAVVEVEGRRVAELGPGEFVGEIAWLTGRPATAAVRATDSIRVFAWPMRELTGFLDSRPELGSAFQLLVGTGLARKLAAPR